MFGTFKLFIDMGNAGTETAADVAMLLREVADRIDYEFPAKKWEIRDINGNQVGEWEVSEI